MTPMYGMYTWPSVHTVKCFTTNFANDLNAS